MGMGFAPTWLRQVSPPPPGSQNHFNHWNYSVLFSVPVITSWAVRTAELRSAVLQTLDVFRSVLRTGIFVHFVCFTCFLLAVLILVQGLVTFCF